MPIFDAEGRRGDAVETDASAVRSGGEGFCPVPSVHLDRVEDGAAFVQVGVVAGVPDHPVTAALAEDLVVGITAYERVVLAAAEEHVEAALAEECVIPALAVEQVAPRAAGKRVVVGAAEEARLRQRPVDLAQRDHVVPGEPEDLDPDGVGHGRRPPVTGIAPPFTRILPAASRLRTIELPVLSPVTVRIPELNVAVVAALAEAAVPRNTAAPSATATSKRRPTRRGTLFRSFFIVRPPSGEPGSVKPSLALPSTCRQDPAQFIGGEAVVRLKKAHATSAPQA